MNSKKIIILIGVMLVVFVLFKVIADQLCAGGPNNAVTAAVSEVISNATPTPNPTPSNPDPLSWEPLVRQLVLFLSKVCNR